LWCSVQDGKAASNRAAGAAGLVAAAAAAAGAAALLAAVPLWFCIACPVCGHAAALVLLCLPGSRRFVKVHLCCSELAVPCGDTGRAARLALLCHSRMLRTLWD